MVRYHDDETTVRRKQQTIDRFTDRVVKAMRRDHCDSVYKKCLWLHNMMVRHCTYDHDAVGHSEEKYAAYSMDGFFLEHRAVCSGIAMAYRYLCGKVGVDRPLLLVTEEDPEAGDVLIVDNDNVSADRTDRSTVIGMRGYMAPEIVRSRSRSALRSAILMGDAIGDEEARRAVRGFVKDGDQSIVAVQDSEQIISRIVTATVKTIRGIPQAAAEQDDAPSPAPDAFAYPAGTDAPEFPGGSVLSF